jgi:hypothetical protein
MNPLELNVAKELAKENYVLHTELQRLVVELKFTLELSKATGNNLAQLRLEISRSENQLYLYNQNIKSYFERYPSIRGEILSN